MPEPVKATILGFLGASRGGPASLTVRHEDGIILRLYVEHHFAVGALRAAYPGCVDDEGAVNNKAIAGERIYYLADQSGLFMVEFWPSDLYEDVPTCAPMDAPLEQESESAAAAPAMLTLDLDPTTPEP